MLAGQTGTQPAWEWCPECGALRDRVAVVLADDPRRVPWVKPGQTPEARNNAINAWDRRWDSIAPEDLDT